MQFKYSLKFNDAGTAFYRVNEGKMTSVGHRTVPGRCLHTSDRHRMMLVRAPDDGLTATDEKRLVFAEVHIVLDRYATSNENIATKKHVYNLLEQLRTNSMQRTC